MSLPIHPIDEHVAIFWDYENCAPPTSTPGYDVVNNIRQVAHEYGSVKLFKAYLELSEQSSSKSIGLRSELQSCGVSLTDCPHNGRKDVADKMMIVDMLTYAIDNPAPATIVLISGDRDFVYAVSVLRLRKYRVVLVAPYCAHASLKSQASAVLNWETDIMGKTTPRPGTLEASHNASDDALQRSSRRPSCASQLGPPPTPRHGRRLSFKTNTPITPITPEDSNKAPCGSLFEGTHKRNPSIVTTDECLPTDTALHSDIPQLCKALDSIQAQPPIPDIVDFMQYLKGPRLQPPSQATLLTDVASLQRTSVPPMTAVNVAAPTFAQSPAEHAYAECDMETNSVNQDLPLNGTEPASAPPQRLNTNLIIAPEPIPFPHRRVERPIVRPATVEPLSRVLSVRVEPSSVPASISASSSSSECTFHTPVPIPSKAIDATPPTSALDVEESSSSDAGQPHPPLSEQELSSRSRPPSPTPTGILQGSESSVAPPVDSTILAEETTSIPRFFHPLVKALEESRLRGALKPLRSWVGLRIPPGTYAEAKVSSFKQYTAAAEKAGIVELGGLQAKAWIALSPEWHGKVYIQAAPS
ncbi:NYN domain-containing protein [Ganoderma leucocontextum]|nr:NYN domain-containing protein [Ganoderma leucocontextum]